MVDEKKIIAKLQTRIDEFVKRYPKEKDCVSVQAINEFIHMLQLEAKEQESEE